MARLLGNPGILGQGGRYMAVHPGIILECPGYLGIPGYLDKGRVYGCPSWDNPGMARLLGNLEIPEQGGVYGCPSWDNPGMSRLLGNLEIPGQAGLPFLR